MEHKSLLNPGLHDFELNEIETYFLNDFPNSKTRKSLIDGLNAYVAHLSNIGVPIELWIDGSFATHKENPNDIDLVIFSSASILDSLPHKKQQLFQALIDRDSMQNKFGCDVLFCPTEDQNMRSYWRGWYGFDRNEQPKGIARITTL